MGIKAENDCDASEAVEHRPRIPRSKHAVVFALAYFPDLDDEQYLAKIGQKNPRADLYIPSIKVMVEAKFIRKGKSFQSIIDEIAADASLYSAMGNEFAGLIAFVWDDSGRSHEHDYLKQGLGKLQGVLGTVVVSRPADWQEVTPAPLAASKVLIDPETSISTN